LKKGSRKPRKKPSNLLARLGSERVLAFLIFIILKYQENFWNKDQRTKMKGQKMEQHFPRLLDVKTAARYLSISRAKLYQWMNSGKIKSYKIDSRRLLDIRDLNEFVENLKKVG